MEKHITVYTDGACRNFHNKKDEHVDDSDLSAWAYLVQYPNGVSVHHSKCDQGRTNNQEELTAVIEALNFLTNSGLATLKAPKVIIVTDSRYVMNAFTKDWIKKWQKRKFKDVKNAQTWKYLLYLINHIARVSFVWQRGHQTPLTKNAAGNDFVDKLCNQAMDQYIEKQKQIKDQPTSKE